MPRPNRYSDEINKRIVDTIYPAVALWLKTGGETEEDEEGVKRDLLKALPATHDESYQIMRNLEDRCYWMVDEDLQETLKRVSFLRYEYHREAVVAWVAAENSVPTFAIGDPVQYVDFRTTIVGEILEINTKDATYVVHSPSMGHVKEGMGTHGRVLPFEDVKPYEPAAQQSEIR